MKTIIFTISLVLIITAEFFANNLFAMKDQPASQMKATATEQDVIEALRIISIYSSIKYLLAITTTIPQKIAAQEIRDLLQQYDFDSLEQFHDRLQAIKKQIFYGYNLKVTRIKILFERNIEPQEPAIEDAQELFASLTPEPCMSPALLMIAETK